MASRGRNGANCTLSYQRGDHWHAYRVRCVGLDHGLMQVAAESRARETRAFYPHERTPAQFMLTFALLGRVQLTDKDSEHVRFNRWMREYMRFLLDLDEIAGRARAMHITIPVRNFVRQAIPLGPLSFGEHVGSMLWNQTITFETTFEPTDKKFGTSIFDAQGTVKDKNARFYYPAGEQLTGNQKPGVYDTVRFTPAIITGAGGLTSETPPPSAVNRAVGAPDNPRQADGRTIPRTQDRRNLA